MFVGDLDAIVKRNKCIAGAGQARINPPASPLAELVSLTVPPQTERQHIILENDSAEAIAELAEHLKKALN